MCITIVSVMDIEVRLSVDETCVIRILRYHCPLSIHALSSIKVQLSVVVACVVRR